MPAKRLWLSLLLVVGLIGVGLAAGADSGSENEFVSLINSTRSNNGLGSLQVDGGLQSHARNHTASMIAAGDIFHSSSGELAAAAGSGWSRVGENVGRGQSPTSLHSAFMNSSGHAANILGDYNYVGVGTDTAPDGALYVTVVFMKKGDTAPPTTAPPPPPDTTVPPPPTDTPATTAPVSDGAQQASPSSTTSSTTTTLPPTTTTTMIVPPDRAVTPGQSCLQATRFARLCHD
ncbi:MAG TPA: CAP domain-containing protein [Acidimicrobiia bacterium]|nr:CAP domain-containing protein [Acidimicrobiia bacterium]